MRVCCSWINDGFNDYDFFSSIFSICFQLLLLFLCCLRYVQISNFYITIACVVLHRVFFEFVNTVAFSSNSRRFQHQTMAPSTNTKYAGNFIHITKEFTTIHRSWMACCMHPGAAKMWENERRKLNHNLRVAKVDFFPFFWESNEQVLLFNHFECAIKKLWQQN